MGKLKFYVLTSKNLYALKKHADPRWSGIPKELLYVIINTTDLHYTAKASEYLHEEGIDFEVTISDGTPSTGKNSFLDVFKSHDDVDYAVLIDGDDWLTQHGVLTYMLIAAGEDTPDVICLKNQFSLWPQETVWEKETDANTIPCRGTRFFIQDNWQNALTGRHVKIMRDSAIKQKLFKTKAQAYRMYPKRMEKIYAEWSHFNYHYIDGTETHSRVVMLSKKAAEYRFDGEHRVGEDTIQYFELKDAAMRGELKMYALDETIPTYIYDQRISGVAVDTTWEDGGQGFMNWLEPLVNKYKSMEENGMMHGEDLPELEIEYPIGYIPHVHKLVDWREIYY